MNDDVDSRLAALSSRERQVFELMVKGLANADIASALAISLNTVKTHVTNIIRKLDVTNRTEAVGLTSRREAARKQSDAPAVAVLPFVVHSTDPLDNLRADAIVDDLINMLGRRWFPVIGRCSVLSVHNRWNDGLVAAAAALSARYLVEGSIRPTDRTVRCNMRLIDAHTHRVLWSTQVSSDYQELLSAEQEFVSAIASAVSTAVVEHEARAAAQLAVPLLKPWELSARGMSAFWQGGRDRHQEAQHYFQRALEEAPDLRLAHYGLALTYQREVIEQWGDSVDGSCAALGQATDRFLGQHPSDPWAHLMRGYVATYDGSREDAIASVRRTLDQEPSSVRGRSLHGQLLAMAGRSDEAVVEINAALRLSPHAPDRWSQECVMALAHFAGRRYELAVEWAKRSLDTRKVSSMPFMVLASSYAHLQAMPEARRALEEAKRVHSTYSSGEFQRAMSSTDPEIAARYIEGLQRAAS